jgi:hypothetical protein
VCGAIQKNVSLSQHIPFKLQLICLFSSVPDPDPLDPHIFGPPRSGSDSTIQRYGSGSGSFYHQVKIVRKTYCFLTSFGLFIFEKDVNVTSKSKKQKNFIKKLVFCWPLEGQ